MHHNIWHINNPEDHGPFDIIGDVHGCYNELILLMEKLGWQKDNQGQYHHPKGRKLCFVGDLVDRGPNSPSVLKLAMQIVESKQGYWVKGNHDDRWARYVKGNNIQISHGIKETIEQFTKQPKEFMIETKDFIEDLPIYLILDDGKLIIAHAGLKEELHGINSERSRAFALFGQPTGKYDEKGYPIRYRWQDDYQGRPTIVYGHVALDEVEAINNCYDIDTSCVFGEKLTALRWPEMEFIDVPSQTKWKKPTIKHKERDR
ncbi:MAG: metallophosphoesterase [Alphaproteobacteria bacterium]